MEKQIVGIGEMVIIEDANVELVAPNLGSCLAVSVYDAVTGIGGMVHCLLPLSRIDPKRGEEQPATYVDTGVVELLNSMIRIGSRKEDFSIKVAGCATMGDRNDHFAIGKKNYTVLRKILWKNSLLIDAESVGGAHSRSLTLALESGKVWVRTQGIATEL